MNILTLDCETTISNKGNWADKRNKLVMYGSKWLHDDRYLTVYQDCLYDSYYYKSIQQNLEKADYVIGFNIKFDLHWLKNIGVDVSNIKRVWDCQIAEFLLEHQRISPKENKLNRALAKYGFPLKLDIVKTEYWDKGIDTDSIPVEILREYLEYDLIGTENVFKEQAKQFGVML